MQKVDDVSQKVRDIVSGKITDFEAFDKEHMVEEDKEVEKLALRTKQRLLAKREAEEAKRKEIIMGKEGRGEKAEGYDWFCKKCFTEYTEQAFVLAAAGDASEGLVDATKEVLPNRRCARCGNEKLMSRDDRQKELMEKLDDYKEEKAKHQVRKDKWVRWKKSQALLGKSKVINYKAWEFWEPDTDDEELENAEPVVPKGTWARRVGGAPARGAGRGRRSGRGND